MDVLGSAEVNKCEYSRPFDSLTFADLSTQVEAK